MNKETPTLRKPNRFMRLFFRAPLALYALGFGRLLGTRFLRLTHTGRKTGSRRQTVLEVVRYDRATGACVVASGWGKTSDWYRNVSANPQVAIQINGRAYPAVAVRLSSEEAGQELSDYAHRNPRAFRYLARSLGYRLDGSEANIRAMGERIPMVMFQPASLIGQSVTNG